MTRQISGMLVPWIAALVFWTGLHSAWATIIAAAAVKAVNPTRILLAVFIIPPVPLLES